MMEIIQFLTESKPYTVLSMIIDVKNATSSEKYAENLFERIELPVCPELQRKLNTVHIHD